MADLFFPILLWGISFDLSSEELWSAALCKFAMNKMVRVDI